MNKIFLVILLFSTSYPQAINDLHSNTNIRKFADYLFSDKDYLRSVFEYEKLPSNDTIKFKIALAYQQMEEFNSSIKKFADINSQSVFYTQALIEKYKTIFLAEDYLEIQSQLKNKSEDNFQRLLYLSYLFTSNNLPEENVFLKPFPETENLNLSFYYEQKKDPPYKSPFLAGTMSAIIPGSGKIYTGDAGDGIAAFIATSLLTFLSYDNFNHNHNFRGWLFAGLGFFFYAGNIYGSVSSAQIHNAKVDYEFNENLKEYLKAKNYFLPENDFIK